ncbi:Translocation Protein Sec62 [Manis pentadactyla]|nr:Translocation Protein Sec62 [Manis pentadactyla]
MPASCSAPTENWHRPKRCSLIHTPSRLLVASLYRNTTLNRASPAQSAITRPESCCVLSPEMQLNTYVNLQVVCPYVESQPWEPYAQDWRPERQRNQPRLPAGSTPGCLTSPESSEYRDLLTLRPFEMKIWEAGSAGKDFSFGFLPMQMCEDSGSDISGAEHLLLIGNTQSTAPLHIGRRRNPITDMVHTHSLDSGQVARDRFVSQEKVLLSGASGGLAQDRPEVMVVVVVMVMVMVMVTVMLVVVVAAVAVAVAIVMLVGGVVVVAVVVMVMLVVVVMAVVMVIVMLVVVLVVAVVVMVMLVVVAVAVVMVIVMVVVVVVVVVVIFMLVVVMVIVMVVVVVVVVAAVVVFVMVVVVVVVIFMLVVVVVTVVMMAVVVVVVTMKLMTMVPSCGTEPSVEVMKKQAVSFSPHSTLGDGDDGDGDEGGDGDDDDGDVDDDDEGCDGDGDGDEGDDGDVDDDDEDDDSDEDDGDGGDGDDDDVIDDVTNDDDFAVDNDDIDDEDDVICDDAIANIVVYSSAFVLILPGI